MDDMERKFEELLATLTRLTNAVESIAPSQAKDQSYKIDQSNSFLWQAENKQLLPLAETPNIEIDLILAVDNSKRTLYQNTLQFAQGFTANNALLWGARGMGKSSLVKAIHKKISEDYDIKLIEIYRKDLDSLPILLKVLSSSNAMFILFCDDLSFEVDDSSYKALKSLLDGSIIQKPRNVIFYATSNFRNLLPRNMIENQQSTAINPSEIIDEKISLSDRFGLWLGFYPNNQEDYLNMVNCYVEHFKLELPSNYNLKQEALAWAMARGNRSGRTAWQFIQQVAGELKQKI